MKNESKADVYFHVQGTLIPVDHGYALYSTISKVLPSFHEETDVGMKLIRGRYIGDGMLDISTGSELVFRLPISRIGAYLPIAGRSFDIIGQTINLGVPNTRAIKPSEILYAHLVTTKNGNDQFRFESEIDRQLNELNITQRPTIIEKRTFQIRGKQMVGYSVKIENLKPEESVALQECGLGGRRKMGCGFFEIADE